jgi:beta-lactam-binding protein with PASTA domain
MGEVFRAHDAVLARDVAIKVLHRSLASDQGFVERFRREARAAASLNHPNIVAVHDWGAVDGIYYMVMELVGGRSVRHLLNAKGRLEPSQSADIVRQTLLALEHAHDRGMVHRDIKPENLLVASDGTVKVADFGLARAYAEGRATQAGTVTGTVQYLAPEQIRGEPADPRTDLYSLGVVTFEILTGRLPFTGETAMAIAMKHVSQRVPPPSGFAPELPPVMDAFVASATERERELRPATAREMRSDLEGLMAELSAAPSLRQIVSEVSEVIEIRPAGRARSSSEANTITLPKASAEGRRPVRRAIGFLAILALLAASGYGTWVYLIPHRVTVPNLIHGTVAQARTQMEALGLSVAIGRGRYSMTTPAGQVLRIQPQAGAILERGSSVTITGSLGPPPVPVPSVVGSSLADATKALEQADLSLGSVKHQNSNQIPKGDVISQVQSGSAPKGSGVDLVVSDGPPPLPVPAVTGKDLTAARAGLEAAGFKVKVEQKFSGSVPPGQVMSEDPKRGTVADYGSTITLIVSKGPQSFPTPDLVGLSVSQARAKATSLGLRFTALPVPGATGTRVVSQIPTAGSTIKWGALVAVYYA